MMKRMILSTLLVLLAVTTISSAQDSRPLPDRPFAYTDTQNPVYSSLKISSDYAPMSDGTKLAVDIYLPSDRIGTTADQNCFPVILQYTPYGRSEINPETGKVYDLTTYKVAQYFTSFGYAMVVADIRGTGASSGWLLDCMPQLAVDGKELVDWLARQTWCDGNVGMSGSSYVGWSQWATASQRPEALKCIAPAVVYLDLYSASYPGGIFGQGYIQGWTNEVYKMRQNSYLPDEHILPSKPVVDEDGDGELADEVPVDKNGNGRFLDDGFPPSYRDGQPRTDHVYFKATQDHEENYDLTALSGDLLFRDASFPLGYSCYDLSPASRLKDIMESDIPIYHFGGWFDAYVLGTWRLFCTLDRSNPQKIVMFPGYHDYTGGAFFRYLGLNRDAVGKQVFLEHRRFFDRYLKGIDNGIDREPPISIYVMNGEGWRFEHEWPLDRQVETRYYLDGGRRLSTAQQQDGTDTYNADYTHSSKYGRDQGNRWLSSYGVTPRSLPIRTDKESQCLVYTSAAMSEDVEVTGHPIVDLWVSSTEDYGDFYIYLEDVDEKGESLLVTEGRLRAEFATLYDNDAILPPGTGIDIKPDLPWHGYDKDQYVDRPFADGKVVELRFDCLPISWVFRAGHSIRVSLACADWPTFRLHEKLCPSNDPGAGDNKVPTVTIYHDSARPSHVILPIIPKEERLQKTS
jgi:putative CocE/NonD family hydrolase